MVFTAEQDAFIVMAHYRSGNLNPDGTWIYNLESCIEQFVQQFPDPEFNRHNFVNHKHNIIRRFEEGNCICKGKSTRRPTKLTPERMADIEQRITTSPKKSLRKLAAQTGLALGTVHTAVKKRLHFHPYKVRVVQQLLPPKT